MSTDQTDLLRSILDDPIVRIEGLLTVPAIENDLTTAIPFKLTKVQRDFLQNISKWQEEGSFGGHYRVTVKARQVKMSSVIMARNFTDAMLRPNFNCLVVTQDDDTKSLFRDRALMHLHDLEAVGLAPKVTSDNTYELEFGEINSRIIFRTATEKIRAYTWHRIHLTEAAFYENGGDVLAAVLPAMPKSIGEIDIESTPNGPSGMFHATALAGERGEEWQLVFYPWWWEESYVDDPKVYLTTPLSEREEYLRATHNLTDEQISFRRRTHLRWRSLGSEAPPVEQEYAEDIDSCFVAGEGAAFSNEELVRVKNMVREPLERRGDLWIWMPPMPGEGYVIGADVASGGATLDNSAACVLNRMGMQVAGFYGKIDSIEFAGVLDALGILYNDAYLVPEGWPGEGSVTCAILMDRYKYHNLHYSEMGGQPRPGFITSAKTRQDLVRAILEAVKFGQSWIHDERLYQELRTLVWYTGKRRKLRPKLQAQGTANDDYAVAMGLAFKHLAFAQVRNKKLGGFRQTMRGWVGF